MSHSKVKDLLAQFEQHQKDQLECLKSIISLIPKDDLALKKATLTTDRPDEAPTQGTIEMPDDWALPWSDWLLRHRVEERGN